MKGSLMFRKLHSDAGFSLVAVLVIGIIMMMVTAGIAFRVVSDLDQARYDRGWQRALHVSDAGIDHVLYALVEDDTFVQGPMPPGPFADNQAEKTWVLAQANAAPAGQLTTVTEGQWWIMKPTTAEAQIWSVGFVPSRTDPRYVRVLRVAYDFAPFEPGGAFVTDGDIEIAGNGVVDGSLGNVHANGDVKVTGGSATITGTLTSGGNITPNSVLTSGSVVGDKANSGEGFPPVDIPLPVWQDYFDGSEYILCPDGFVWAGPAYSDGPEPRAAPGDVPCTTGSQLGDASSIAYRGWDYQGNDPSAGAEWRVTGNTVFRGSYYIHGGSATITGSPSEDASIYNGWRVTIYAAPVPGTEVCPGVIGGDIEIAGNPDMEPWNTDGILLVGGRDVELRGNPSQGQAQINGFIYAYEQASVQGNPSITGAVVTSDGKESLADPRCDTAGSPVSINEISGSATITYDDEIAVPLGDNIRITHWNEL